MCWLVFVFLILLFLVVVEIIGVSYVEFIFVYGYNVIEGGEYMFLCVELGGDVVLIWYDDVVFEDSVLCFVDFDMDGMFEVLMVVSDFE